MKRSVYTYVTRLAGAVDSVMFFSCASLITFLLWSQLSCQFRKSALSRTFPVLQAFSLVRTKT